MTSGSDGAKVVTRQCPHGQAREARQPQQTPVELFQASVIGDHNIAVTLNKLDSRVFGHAIVVDPRDEIDEVVLTAGGNLLAVAFIAGNYFDQ